MILHPEEKKNGTRFDILTPKATFSCGAESREIAKQWAKAIEQHIPVAAEDLEPAAEAARVCVAQVLRTTGDHFNAVWDTKLLIEIV